MTNAQLIGAVAAEVKTRMEGEGTGHDWFHVERVWKMGKRIAAEENADALVVELACLCHDIADWKFHGGDESAGPTAARELLTRYDVPEETIAAVCDIIAKLSYKGANVVNEITTLEGKVVQDSDRLDAVGAIGIARAFAYGGYVGKALHDPRVVPVLHSNKEEYKQMKGTTINHFHEKLLLLRDRMHTKTGKKVAKGRHAFTEAYLKQFLEEWDGIA